MHHNYCAITMASSSASWWLHGLLLACAAACQLLSSVVLVAAEKRPLEFAWVNVDASPAKSQKISDEMFGISFEEVNHAVAGGLWAELVSNRGFEAGGHVVPSNIQPWLVVGDASTVTARTEMSSPFKSNPIALRVEVLCNAQGHSACPAGGVGVYNPGYFDGMNLVEGALYNVTLHLRSLEAVSLTVSFTSTNGNQTFASYTITGAKGEFAQWRKVQFQLTPSGTHRLGRLQLTTGQSGVFWLDQVSVMPLDTYKGHGFRKDIIKMIQNLKPKFMRFPGGNYVNGQFVQYGFYWKETLGPWEERPGHWNSAWKYYSDDGFGFYQYLQLAEDLNAAPIWVIPPGVTTFEEVPTENIGVFVKYVVEGIEFARGDAKSTWGSVRAQMGHPEPFPLNTISIGNGGCVFRNYKGNYLKFHDGIKAAYPDIRIVTNCPKEDIQAGHPADLYDVHHYPSTCMDLYYSHNVFDKTPRTGAKAFVSEFGTTSWDSHRYDYVDRGNLIYALASATFWLGLERNSDVVEMASGAPLMISEGFYTFANIWDGGFPHVNAIVFDSYRAYGWPHYWVWDMFKESSGATYHPTTSHDRADAYDWVRASAVTWRSADDGNTYVRIKIVNYGDTQTNTTIAITGLERGIRAQGSKKTELTGDYPRQENTMKHPYTIAPNVTAFPDAATHMNVMLHSFSLTSFDLLLD